MEMIPSFSIKTKLVLKLVFISRPGHPGYSHLLTHTLRTRYDLCSLIQDGDIDRAMCAAVMLLTLLYRPSPKLRIVPCIRYYDATTVRKRTGQIKRSTSHRKSGVRALDTS